MPCLMCPVANGTASVRRVPVQCYGGRTSAPAAFRRQNEQGNLCPARHVGVSVGG